MYQTIFAASATNKPVAGRYLACSIEGNARSTIADNLSQGGCAQSQVGACGMHKQRNPIGAVLTSAELQTTWPVSHPFQGPSRRRPRCRFAAQAPIVEGASSALALALALALGVVLWSSPRLRAIHRPQGYWAAGLVAASAYSACAAAN